YTPAKVLFPPVGSFINLVDPTNYREWATFANVTYRFTDRFDITGGARYASNVEGTCGRDSSGILGTGLVPCTTRPWQGKATWLGTSTFHLDPDTMLYARVATGYRPGGGCVGCGNPTLGQPDLFGPDTLTNYEVGLKGQLLDHRLQLELSAFLIDWNDIQQE